MSRAQIRIMLISGMSFFTDAYDLFVIGVVLLILEPIFNINSAELGVLASVALFGAVLGPLIFGYVGDRFGRKNAFWITVTLLIVGAVGSAFSINLAMLLFWRFLLGVGIGGDYPLSSTIVAEYANIRDRGKLISSTFAMQGFGIIAGIVLAVGLLSFKVSPDIVWRVLLGAGAVPVAVVLYYRVTLKETPWYKQNLKNRERLGASRNESEMSSAHDKDHEAQGSVGSPNIWAFLKSHWKIAFATSATWFLMDASYYGTTIFTPYITRLLGLKGLLAPTDATALLLIMASVPGYWVAVSLIDRQGRKSMQYIGFLITGIAFLTLALLGSRILAISTLMFFVIYGFTFFFTNYGPNTTTYVYPAELYPTAFRARGHGIAAMSGKFGAAISALLFPLLLIDIGKFNLIGMLGMFSIAGFIITLILLPETKRKSLALTSGEIELGLVTTTLADEFENLLDYIEKASITMNEALKDQFIEDPEGLFRRVKNLEHNADRYVHDILDYIVNIRSNTIAYMDISHLAKRLDDIIDTEEMASSRIFLYGIEKSDSYIKELTFTILDEMRFVKEAVNKLNALQDADEGKVLEIREEIMNVYKECSRSENVADDILRRALRAVMHRKDLKEIIKYKEIYEDLEEVTDRFVDAMDIISDITLRYTYNNRKSVK